MRCHHAHHKALHGALWIAVVFMALEIVGAILSNSLALVSDALHMFTDVGSLLLSLIVSYIAKRPSTPSMSYGYVRAETIGALASSASLWALSGILIYESILRLLRPEPVIGPIVFVIAVIGFIGNIWMMRLLHPSQHHSINVRAAYLHVISDLLGSAGVILSGLILWFTHWNPIDTLVTIVFTLGILYHSWKVIKTTLTILMESTPEGIDPEHILQTLSQIPGVKEVHDLHIWSVATHKITLSVHLIADPDMNVLDAAHRTLQEKHGIHHMTIQVEDPSSFQREYCYDCTNNVY